MKKVLQTTIELTKAALERGIIKQSRSAPNVELLQLDITENVFNKFCRKGRSNSISDLMGELVLEGWKMDNFGIDRDSCLTRRSVLTWKQLASERILEEKINGDLHSNSKVVVIGSPGETNEESLVIRKRRLSPSEGTQMGSRSKHTSRMKRSPRYRQKMNQTFFVETPTRRLALTTVSPSLRSPAKTIRKKAKRRLNPETKQALITSTFSPKMPRRDPSFSSFSGD